MAIDREATIKLTQELVRAKSVNPPGNEEAVASILEARLKAAGLEIERIEIASGRPNLVATWKGEGNRTLIIHGHMDTVPPSKEGWTRQPFEGTIEGDKLYGVGSADMKSGLAAMVSAIESLKQEGWSPKGNLVFYAAANEEMGDKENIGMRHVAPLLAERFAGEKLVLMGDTSGLDITVAEKGVLWLEVTVKGKEAHGSTPWEGINAIEKLGKFLLALRDVNFKVEHSLLGKSTVSINTITGGYKTNVVPGEAKASVDIRLVPGETKESVLQAVEEVKSKLVQEDRDLYVELKEILFEPATEIKNDELIEQLKGTIKEAIGKEVKVKGVHGATGSGVFERAGIQPIIFGPGHPENAHMADEFIEIEEMVQAAQVYASFAKKWLG